MNIKHIAIATSVLVFLTGCAEINKKMDALLPKDMSPEKKAATKCGVAGAATGGALGAIIGGVTNGGTGAVIGAVAGGAATGLAAGIVCQDKASDKNKDTFNYADTQKRIGYTEKQGNKLVVESIKLDPLEVAQGDELEIVATYYVMTPNKKNEVEVTEEWFLDSYSVGPSKIKIQQGTRETSTKIPLPQDAQKGKHILTLVVKYLSNISKKKTKEIVAKKAIEFTIV